MGIGFALLWHRWFGVLGGAWLFMIAFTGCLLVFHGELDRTLNPELFSAARSTQADPAPVAAALRIAEGAWPGSQAIYVRFAARSGDSMLVALADRPDSPGAVGSLGREVYVDPAAGTLLGSRVFGRWQFDRAHLMPFIYRLHYELHGGATVRWLLGVVALLWLCDHFLAVPLALRSAKQWSDLFKLRRRGKGYKRAFDLHRAWGTWLLPVTAMLAFTGVYFNMNTEFMTALRTVAPPSYTVADSKPDLAEPLYDPSQNADAIIEAARKREPGIAISGLGYNAAKGLWTMYVHDPRDLAPKNASRIVTIDARTGEMVEDRHFSEGTAGDVIVTWQFPLHSGQVFGWLGRILVLLAGVATCTLVVTGYLVWWRKRLSRLFRRRRVFNGSESDRVALAE
jgi:uncharacterized iron-regulated membrane protein